MYGRFLFSNEGVDELGEEMTYSRIARRIRVPLGFLFAAIYLWLAWPTWISMAAGGLVAAAGLWLRAIASGHVKKNSELAITGPYAYTRNPLYLGSLIIALGFAVAARNLWIALIMVLFFLAIYLPVIKSEEEFLSRSFPEFADYAGRVPRLLPLIGPQNSRAGGFSRDLYLQHREYNALIGSALMMLGLSLKLVLTTGTSHKSLW